MEITPATRIAELAASQPATIKVFQKHRIDFCCGRGASRGMRFGDVVRHCQ